MIASARPPSALAQAEALLARGDVPAALALAEPGVRADPQSPDGHCLLAIIAILQKRPTDAVRHAETAAQLDAANARVQFTLGRARKLAGAWPAAIEAYRRAIALDPALAEAHVSLGIALKHSGNAAEAIDCYRRAIELNPSLGVAHANLGLALAAQAERAAKAASHERVTDELLCALALARELEPRNGALHRSYGASLAKAGRHREAADALNLALGLAPEDLEACLRLGDCLRRMGHSTTAIELHRRWLALNPPAAPVMRALSDLLTPAGAIDEALDLAEKAFALDPDAAASLQLAVAYQQSRRIAEAVSLGRRATELAPGQPDFHPLVLLTANYLYEDPVPIFELHARFGDVLEQYCRTIAPESGGSPATRAPGQRLKVGYVSGDFMAHSVSYFVAALLERHDASRFEIVCYHNRAWRDAVTERLRGYGHTWVECASMSDAELAQRIGEDGVHVLVDLAGHTSDSRVNVFGMRAAPVQIGFLGYPTISGVRAMDFRISDLAIDPGDQPAMLSERPICLGRSMFCYRPPRAPEIASSPLLRNGFVTFGSFNNVAKLSDRTLALWSRVMHQVPGSRLLLKSTSMTARATSDNLTAFMQTCGIAPDRLTLVGRVDDPVSHLALYNAVDIALDSFPYNGATTTCEALWMGVPVVSRRGATHASRMGASILRAAGRAQWVAEGDGEFVATATRLAEDAPALETWRRSARPDLERSELLDEAAFVREFESALEEAWSRAGSA